MALRTISVCAGVGGLDLGVRIARPDARCVAFVEREASAAASLVASMEAGRLHPAAVWSDLRTFDAGAWRGAVDCVLSGDPCQGNSVAGKRLGAADDRWLLDRAIEVFDESGASTFFRENVVGNLDGQLAVAIPSLERLGCRVAVGIFSAAEAGASHRRERFFILADRFGEGRGRSPGADRSEQPSVGEQGSAGRGQRRGTAVGRSIIVRSCVAPSSDGRDLGDPDGADAQGRRRGGHPGGREEPSGYARLAGGGVEHAASERRREGRPQHDVRGGRDAATDAGRALATIGEGRPRFRHDRPFAPGPADPIWAEIVRDAPSLEPAVCRVAHGMAGRIERLRHCGNGVVPLAAALAWVRLHGLLADDATGDAVRFADDRTACAGAAAVRIAA